MPSLRLGALCGTMLIMVLGVAGGHSQPPPPCPSGGARACIAQTLTGRSPAKPPAKVRDEESLPAKIWSTQREHHQGIPRLSNTSLPRTSDVNCHFFLCHHAIRQIPCCRSNLLALTHGSACCPLVDIMPPSPYGPPPPPYPAIRRALPLEAPTREGASRVCR